jgi:hypothetical protein
MIYAFAAVGIVPAVIDAAARIAHLAQSAPMAPVPVGSPCPLTKDRRLDDECRWQCPGHRPGSKILADLSYDATACERYVLPDILVQNSSGEEA